MDSRLNKRGIALISVVITILILTMISGIITYVSYDMINLTKETAYAKDLTTISNAVEEYYAVNGSIPRLEDGLEFSAAQYKENIEGINGTNYVDALNDEMTINEDGKAIFYEIDISKIGVDDLKYGVKNDENDLFLVSNDSHIVYYYPGYVIDGNIFFSNTKIINKDN